MRDLERVRTPTEARMTNVPSSQVTDGVPTHVGGGDPAGRLTDYYPTWLDNLADDVTVEGSLLDGAVQGAEAVRTIIVAIRTLYDHQEVNSWAPGATAAFFRTTPGSPPTMPSSRPQSSPRNRAR
jgi:hypothetical protein